jgi:ATP-dependent DNA ligase
VKPKGGRRNVGIRWKNKPEKIATLLLGLYRDDGGLDYVGSAAVAASKHDRIAEQVLPLIDKKSDRRFSEPNRWGTGDLEEQAVKPKLVAEVRYDKVQATASGTAPRFRFRDDKKPKDCTWLELRPPRSERPDAESLLAAE